MSQAVNGSYFTVGVAVFAILTLVGQAARYRSISTETQRQQTKWVLFGFAIALLIILVNVQVLPGFMPSPPEPAAAVYLLYGGLSFDIALLLVPVSIAFAVSATDYSMSIYSSVVR